jgi:hypothetical protein
MTIINCYKLKCDVCGVEGTCQVFFNKAGQLKYGRVRHYQKLDENKKPLFEYHQQSKKYIAEKLKFVLPKITHIDQKQINLDQDADQTLSIFTSNQEVEPPAGFGPATITLPR